MLAWGNQILFWKEVELAVSGEVGHMWSEDRQLCGAGALDFLKSRLTLAMSRNQFKPFQGLRFSFHSLLPSCLSFRYIFSTYFLNI